jgi:hypothetical protein
MRFAPGILALICLGLTACSTVKAFTAPTWVYKNGDARLELLNVNAGSKFCVIRKDSTVCGTYSRNLDVFATAMAHFNRPQGEVPKPDKPSSVEFKPDKGTAWTWYIQPDGSFKDDKEAVWALVEFRQLGTTHTE